MFFLLLKRKLIKKIGFDPRLCSEHVHIILPAPLLADMLQFTPHIYYMKGACPQKRVQYKDVQIKTSEGAIERDKMA